MEKHGLSVFIFRRGLRLEDNTGLIAALESSEKVIPCFIFDPRQVEKNEYFSKNCFQFMTECLSDLNSQLEKKGSELFLFRGLPEDVIEKLREIGVEAVFVNQDYTPFSRKRDEGLRKECDGLGISFASFHDYLLNVPGTIMTGSGTPYKVFTPFHRESIKVAVPRPKKNDFKNYYSGDIDFSENLELLDSLTGEKNENLYARGGRRECLKILGDLKKHQNYGDDRDFPARKGTTGLSAHNKFGTCSIREVYYAVADKLGKMHDLLRQLYWRDFYAHISYHFPHVFGKSFNKEYDGLIWTDDEDAFKAWCRGNTGFPIVDAGMRQLNATGYMHNRVRMISASFLVKDLHVDWRKGEKYFAQKLVDYDPAQNNGNWQWAASTGCDAQPYFRVFNPWLQQQKFDKDCEYIKKWVPELRDVDSKVVHELYEESSPPEGYILPMVDHHEEKEKTIEMFKKIK